VRALLFSVNAAGTSLATAPGVERALPIRGSRRRARQRGAVYVETLIVFLPVLFFFMVTLQLIELWAGSLVVRHAAWMAARAASVVLPDDPAFYGSPENRYEGKRREEITQAARVILRAKSQFDAGAAVVDVRGQQSGGPLDVTVRAPFRCFARFVNIVCAGGASRELVGRATHVYHGASYGYD